MRLNVLWMCGLLVAATAAPLQASFISRTISYDLNDMVPLFGGDSLSGSGTPVSIASFQANVGDVIETTIQFLPGQSLTLINGLTEAWGFGAESLSVLYVDSRTPTSTEYSELISLTFINGSGNLNPYGGGGVTAIGSQLFGNITDSSFTFTGFTMQSTVVSQPNPERNYDTLYFWSAIAGDTTINSVAAVPEAGSLCVWGIGCAGVMAARRCRRLRKV